MRIRGAARTAVKAGMELTPKATKEIKRSKAL